MEKILVIEDNDLLRDNISEILKMEGYEVESAENGQIGVEKALETFPDLIVSDVNMPIMDGFQVLEKLKQDDKVNTIPFIFLTVKNTMQELRAGMNLGADDYLTKPFDMNQLLLAVRTRLNKRNEVVAKESEKYDQLKNAVGLPITAVIDDPLRNIERLAELVSEQLGNLSGQDIGVITKLIATDASKLRKDINKVLYFYRVEALKSNPDSLEELSSQVTSGAKSIISTITKTALGELKRKPDLTIHVEDADLMIPQEFLEYIIRELLSNACHFSTKGSAIKVNGSQLGNAYRLQIQDTGIGFRRDHDLNDVAPYIRLSQDQGKKDGLGLGLYNVKTLVELFDAQIELNSEPGIGTSINLTFSLSE